MFCGDSDKSFLIKSFMKNAIKGFFPRLNEDETEVYHCQIKDKNERLSKLLKIIIQSFYLYLKNLFQVDKCIPK